MLSNKFNFRDALRLLLEVALFGVSFVAAFLLRFDARIPSEHLPGLLLFLPWVIAARALAFWHFGLFRGVWRYVSTVDLIALGKAVAASTVLIAGGIFLASRFSGFPRSIVLIDAALVALLSGSARLLRRAFCSNLLSPSSLLGAHGKSRSVKRVLVVGGGDAGESLLRDIERRSGEQFTGVAVVDDDPAKQGKDIHLVPVVGGIDRIPQVVEEWDIDSIFVAIPSATSTQMQRIVQRCRDARRQFSTIPALGDDNLRGAYFSELREVRLEDIVGRPSTVADLSEVSDQLGGKKVLVTGAGGSIGSQLCHQILRANPKQLILFDKAENSLFDIHRSLAEANCLPAARYQTHDAPEETGDRFPTVVPILGDITNRAHIDNVIREYRPDFVFHAAAHKHVPLTEINPAEAVRNNVGGTRNVVLACGTHGVGTFVLLSTDKAADPINIMGLTKRIAEGYVSAAAIHYGARFLSVRFGNVLESSGSVVSVFKEQLSRKKPLTVTHPEATRYFMSKSEAVNLVLQAAALARGGAGGGGIYVLAMGEPVKILDVARELILLAGYTPGIEVDVVFTGLRPGEKLVEELVGNDEEAAATSHPKISSVVTHPSSWFMVNRELEQLGDINDSMGLQQIKARLRQVYRESQPQRATGTD